MKKYNCIIFTSKETSWVAKDAEDVVSSYMDIIKIFTNSRSSQSINEIKSDPIFSSQVDFVFNYLAPKKFPKWLIDLPNYGCYNFHPGSNKYPGVGSASFAIYNQESKFGLTAHKMDEHFDSGEIINELYFDIDIRWGAPELFNAALENSKLLLRSTIELLIQNPTPPKISSWLRAATTREEFLDWMVFEIGKDSRDLNLLVKSLKHPHFPGPYVKINDNTFVLTDKSI